RPSSRSRQRSPAARRWSYRRPRPASARPRSSRIAETGRVSAASASGRRSSGSATGSTRATAPETPALHPRASRALVPGQGASQLADRLLVLLVLDLAEVTGDFQQHALVRRRRARPFAQSLVEIGDRRI